MRIHALVILIFASSVFAAESRPSKGDIQKATARADALRRQNKLLPDVLQSSAAALKAGAVPCGCVTLNISDAKGENGAAYLLRESYSVGMAEAGQRALVSYRGTLFLSADLALLSGKCEQIAELTDKASAKHQLSTTTIAFSVKDGALHYDCAAQRKGEGEPFAKESKTIALHGLRPMPKNALAALAALQMAKGGGWKPDPKEALCVPVLEINWDLNSISVQPAWVSFDAPSSANAKNAAAVMRVRMIPGELTEKGLEIEPPAPALWQAREEWALDGGAHVLAFPPPDDPRIKIEPADPAAVDSAPPLDLEKIGDALKK